MPDGSALDLVEEAAGLLRSQTPAVWARYLVGTVPLTLAVLQLVHDTTSGFGATSCLTDSVLCAAAFLWASFWKTRFAGLLLASLRDEPAPHWNRNAQCAYLAAMAHSAKLFLWPLAAISIAPFPWLAALFHGIYTESNRPDAAVATVFTRAARSSAAGSRQNWAGLLICITAGAVLWVNIVSVLTAAVILLHAFTGTENQWTRNAGQTFFHAAVAALALTWLLLDPLLQAYSAVRTFYFEGKTDGRDLLVRLRRLSTLAALALTISAPCFTQTLTASEVKHDVEQLTGAKEYSWLRPIPENNGSFLDRLADDLGKAGHATRTWLHGVGEWFRRLFAKEDEQSKGGEDKTPPPPHLSTLLIVAALLIASTAALLLIRRTPKVQPPPARDTVASAPVNMHEALATDQSDEEWLRLAHDYEARGELRLAIRALYLANLSFLGTHNLLAIARAKTNRLYERELRMRARADELCQAFAQSNRAYESVWYGCHEVTLELRSTFQGNVEALRKHA